MYKVHSIWCENTLLYAGISLQECVLAFAKVGVGVRQGLQGTRQGHGGEAAAIYMHLDVTTAGAPCFCHSLHARTLDLL